MDEQPEMPQKPSEPGPSRGRRRIFVVLTLLIPLLLVLLLEGGLRLFGFGQSHPLFVPLPEDDAFLRVNNGVVRRFMVDESQAPNLWIRPVYFEREKRPETFRIFVQGGSTAEGYPYGFTASPAGLLQQRLQRTFPERRIEVVTTAMSAVNSYTLLDFSAEILDQKPDAVVIYAGHNEYVGIFGVGSGYSVGRRRSVVLSYLAFRDSRIFQLGQRVLAASRPQEAARQEKRTLMATIVTEKKIPYGSALFRQGLEQYRANLRALLRRYRRAGIPVFIGTVVSNERDQSPFTSGHGPDVDIEAWQRHFEAGRAELAAVRAEAALEEFAAAVAFDDAHAEGHFGRAQALDVLGRYDEARTAYLAAKDRDELRFRAPEEINVILREVAAAQGAHVVDVEAALRAAARGGIVGYDLMLEHLHPNLEGYYLMADAFYEALREKELIGPWDRAVSSEVARRELPVNEVDRLYGEYRIQGLTSDWPFSKRKEEFRIAPATNRIEEIARDYFKGRHEWPAAMEYLVHHHRRSGDLGAAARIAMLLAEAFPNNFENQEVAAELARRAGRPEADIYQRRAAQLASRQKSR